jgi:hypothetical protein
MCAEIFEHLVSTCCNISIRTVDHASNVESQRRGEFSHPLIGWFNGQIIGNSSVLVRQIRMNVVSAVADLHQEAGELADTIALLSQSLM